MLYNSYWIIRLVQIKVRFKLTLPYATSCGKCKHVSHGEKPSSLRLPVGYFCALQLLHIAAEMKIL
jgi:hypothetical protein